MGTKIFVNLTVKNLDKTAEFFTRLGFKFNPQFTGADAALNVDSKMQTYKESSHAIH